VEIRDALGLRGKTLIFGNGDVKNITEAHQKVAETGCDGVMLGRAIFGNPWLFAHDTSGDTNGRVVGRDPQTISIPERLEALVAHTKLFEELLGDVKNFAIMKKHYKAYVNGWEGASDLRQKLMEAPDAKGVEDIVREYLKTAKIS
jgi:tRNA-dihydrouridine synthase